MSVLAVFGPEKHQWRERSIKATIRTEEACPESAFVALIQLSSHSLFSVLHVERELLGHSTVTFGFVPCIQHTHQDPGTLDFLATVRVQSCLTVPG